jgi:hypothetical protein
VADRQASLLGPEQLDELLTLLEVVDSVELKLSVPDDGRRSAVEALEMDPLAAQIRQVFFFDTPDLSLNASGVVVRVRRLQGKPADSIVKARPFAAEDIASRGVRSPNFTVEVDAMPGGFVCSGTMKAEVDDAAVKKAVAGQRPLRKLFTKEQRDLYEAKAPPGLSLENLVRLGPINVLKLKFTPRDFGRRMIAELWNYPDGSRLLELSTKCGPHDAFEVAAEAKAFLGGRGIDLASEQQTKTKRALEFFAQEVRRGESADG